MFGKWHLGDNYPFRPHDRGFDEALYHRGGGVSQAPDHWRNDYFDDTYMRNGTPEPCEGYCTDVWFREGTRFIERCIDERPGQPFFCYISTNAPHGPLNVPERYVEPYRGKVPDGRARFYAMIECIDENVGRLRTRIRELGIARDTLFIFMTDNGTASGCDLDKQGFVTGGYNAGMRGVKGSEYDGGHRVPFIMRCHRARRHPPHPRRALRRRGQGGRGRPRAEHRAALEVARGRLARARGRHGLAARRAPDQVAEERDDVRALAPRQW
jgi:arylsulfatase A-like enzyme